MLYFKRKLIDPRSMRFLSRFKLMNTILRANYFIPIHHNYLYAMVKLIVLLLLFVVLRTHYIQVLYFNMIFVLFLTFQLTLVTVSYLVTCRCKIRNQRKHYFFYFYPNHVQLSLSIGLPTCSIIIPYKDSSFPLCQHITLKTLVLINRFVDYILVRHCYLDQIKINVRFLFYIDN